MDFNTEKTKSDVLSPTHGGKSLDKVHAVGLFGQERLANGLHFLLKSEYIACSTMQISCNKLTFDLAHDTAYNKTCATREDSDQHAQPHSLIRVFDDRMCLPTP